VVPLDLLCPGEIGCVVDIDGDQDLVHRLAEMGVRPGVELQMVRSGSPCIIALENRRVSFRGERAAAILVEVASAGKDAPPAVLQGVGPNDAVKQAGLARRGRLGRWLGVS
jgi:ferrous iron transport protein A